MYASTIYYKINLKMSKFKSCHCPKLGHISKLLTKFSQYQTFSVSGCIWVPGGAFFNTKYILEQYALSALQRLVSALPNWFQLVYGSFVQSYTHHCEKNCFKIVAVSIFQNNSFKIQKSFRKVILKFKSLLDFFLNFIIIFLNFRIFFLKLPKI